MNNNLQKSSVIVPFAETVNQQANKIYNIETAASVSTGNINNTYIFTSENKPSSQISNGALGQSHEYYNLFVIGGEEFTAYKNGYFMVPKDRALTEYMSADIKDEIDSLTPEAIQRVKSFPAIFCSENRQYGKADDDQEAFFGFITEISVQDNGIKIHYLSMYPVHQDLLNERRDEFNIAGTNYFTELNRTHWCVKRNNLYETLNDVGIAV
ncbi:MAG: hypothetical protein LIO87_02455 [Eubacterium sp.]|nr:hypothetical protein [Eubacterium sp.]MCC8160954.1 hypothetical protein [Oscillospiraceae bacterium]